MNLQIYSYRFAQEALNSERYRQDFQELCSILGGCPIVRRGEPPWSNKSAAASRFPLDQDGMNNYLKDQFVRAGWESGPKIVPESNIAADFKKNSIQIEVQFGNIARYAYDILKFQISYSVGEIEFGIIVVPISFMARLIGDNIASFERIVREMPHMKLAVTLPILIIGLDPRDDPAFLTPTGTAEQQALFNAIADEDVDALPTPLAEDE